MVREQQSPRHPLGPSNVNTQPTQKVMEKQGKELPTGPFPGQTGQDNEYVSSPQPVFGMSTQLGPSPQPLARPQPPLNPANTSAPRQPSSHRTRGHSNLFISAKSSHRPELHKPKPGLNPLAQLHKPPKSSNPLLQSQSQSQSQNRSAVATVNTHAKDDSDDEVFIIAEPTAPPSWKPKAISYPTFSSNMSSGPARANGFVGAALDSFGTSSGGGFVNDPFAYSDPNNYMDADKASDALVALFEGSIEDEDDKPGTPYRPSGLDPKVVNLAEQLQNMKMAAETGSGDHTVRESEDDGSRKGLKVKLLPHQIAGVDWMRSKELGRKNGKGRTNGGILADDMGLGKTIQSIALILGNPMSTTAVGQSDKAEGTATTDRGTLVVAPLALIKQWETEIKDRIDDDHRLKVCVHHGPKRAKSFKELRNYDVVITTYSTLTSEHAASSDHLPVGIYGLNWYRVILDEAHSIKNRNAKSTRAAYALDARYRWCLTGTPMQNNLEELQSLIHFLRIEPLSKLEYWRDQIARPMSSGRGGLAIKRLQAVLRNIMKRRTKDVLKQGGALKTNDDKPEQTSNSAGFRLVKRTVEKIEAQFTPSERSFYQRLESRTDQRLELMMAGNKMSYASALVLLMRLRQACNHPKLIGSDLGADKDAVLDASQTPHKKGNRGQNDTDELTAMLGGLTVENKLCDVCQGDLTKAEIGTGTLRCVECENDIAEQIRSGQDKKRRRKDRRAVVTAERRANRRIVMDSDDEDGSPSQTKSVGLSYPSLPSLHQSDNSSNDDDNDDNDEEEEDEEEEEDDDDEDSQYGLEADATPDLVSSTKIRHLLSILQADAHEHKYIVFSVFTSMLDLIEPFLKRFHIKFVRYDGGMRNDLREASLDSLRHDATVRVLLCSLRAGSLGLNLTAASRVVVLEPFWNPFVEEQAIDRVHRLNQTRDVVVYKMTIKDTVEARILELQEKKRALAQATVEGHSASGVGKLSMQEMLNLFHHGAERDAKVDMLGMRDGKSFLRDGDRTDMDDARDVGPAEPKDTNKQEGRQAPDRLHLDQDRIRDRDRDGHRDRRKEQKPRRDVPEAYARRW